MNTEDILNEHQEPNKDIEDILSERQRTHGSFKDNAHVAQELKHVVHLSRNKDSFTDVQSEALAMILHKVARICSGNPNEKDHWDDIAGYAKLVVRDLTEAHD